jgi:SRSO17 transposase
LGKRANCQALVSLTLARRETPVPVALRLYLPEAWASDGERRRKCGVPEDLAFKKKGVIALEELGLLIEAGVRFGVVLADAGYGVSSAFRAGLRLMNLRYAVGVAANQGVYPPDVAVTAPERLPARTGRPRRHAKPSCPAVSAEAFIADLESRQGARGLRKVTWRGGTKGDLSGRFYAARVRAADGRADSRGRHLPNEHEEWLICEQRAGGERRYYLCNLPATVSLLRLVQSVKARWSCEQAHQQMKNELGLDHYEGRSWLGLHHHALLCMTAMCFLQTERLSRSAAASPREKKRGPSQRRSTSVAQPSASAPPP